MALLFTLPFFCILDTMSEFQIPDSQPDRPRTGPRH